MLKTNCPKKQIVSDLVEEFKRLVACRTMHVNQPFTKHYATEVIRNATTFIHTLRIRLTF
jgi:hypothetical protein